MSLKGVGVEGSVKGSLSEKLGVAKYCILPGVVNAASKRGSTGWNWSLAARPSTFIFLRQDRNSAAKNMSLTQAFNS